MNHDEAIAVGTAHIAALRQIEQLRIELDEARLERDTEQAFRHKANARADAAVKASEQLRAALQGLADRCDLGIAGMPGSPLEIARAALAATRSQS